MEVSMSKTRRGKYTDNRICYISKCKGDMRLYLRRKGKLPCFSYLVRGKSFSFYRGKIRLFSDTTKFRVAIRRDFQQLLILNSVNKANSYFSKKEHIGLLREKL